MRFVCVCAHVLQVLWLQCCVMHTMLGWWWWRGGSSLDLASFLPRRPPVLSTSTSPWVSFQVTCQKVLLTRSRGFSEKTGFENNQSLCWGLTSHSGSPVTSLPGLGWGLIFTPMVATVMANFTRRRTLALGLGFCSIGLSSFGFNPLFQLLVEMYAWRGALLILGGLSLNIVPCGALIRPQQRSESPKEKVGPNRPPTYVNPYYCSLTTSVIQIWFKIQSGVRVVLPIGSEW